MVAALKPRENHVQESDSAHAEHFASVLRGRRSIDLFTPDRVSIDTLMAAIEVARWAPNHRLTEPWRFYVLGPAAMRAVVDLAVELEIAAKGERAGPLRRARLEAVPGMFVLTSCARRRRAARAGELCGLLLCCAEPNAIPLAARYRSQVDDRRHHAATAVPRPARCRLGKESLVGFFWYGVPKVVPVQKRRPVEEIVTELA